MKYLIFADVHANYAALEAVLDNEDDWDEVLFLGDAVDDGPEPAKTLSTMSSLFGRFVMGNHDRKILDVAAGSAREGQSNHRRWSQWTSDQLSDAHREFLASFEDTARVDDSDLTARLHHGDFDLPDVEWRGALLPDTDEAVFERLADRYDEPLVFFAHSHVQFETMVAGTRFVNPGSVGQTRLGNVEACYAVLEDGRLRFKATDYDADRTIAAMQDLPLDDEFVEARNRVYREGRLPDRYDLPDFESLEERGYR